MTLLSPKTTPSKRKESLDYEVRDTSFIHHLGADSATHNKEIRVHTWHNEQKLSRFELSGLRLRHCVSVPAGFGARGPLLEGPRDTQSDAVL